MRSNYKSAKTIAITFFIAIVSMGISGCSNPLAKSKTPIAVATTYKATTDSGITNATTLTVKPDMISTEITGSGYMMPSKTTSLYYNNLSGTLKRLFIKENDQVKAGQPIAEIQVSDIQKKITDQEIIMKKWQIRMSVVDEQINSSKTSMKLAQLNLDNAKKDSSSSSNYIDQLKLQYDIANSAYKNSLWNKELSQIDYDNDKKILDNLKALENQVVLKSSTNGVVINVENLSDNAMISSGLIIAQIAEPKNMLFRLNTLDSQYINSSNNETLTINKKDYTVSLYLPQPGDQLDNNPNGQTSNNYVYLKFDKEVPPMNTYKPVDVTLKVSKNQVLVLPKEAVYQDSGKNMVDVQYEEGSKPLQVTEGLETQDKVEIVSGLKTGDKVIIR